MRRGVIILGAAGAVVVFPSAALAATAQVVVEPPAPGIVQQRAQLVFDGAAGEANRLTLAPAGEQGGNVRYALRDASSAVTAGSGCSGGGAPGAEVICELPPPRAASGCMRPGICADAGLAVDFDLRLADGDDVLDLSGVPAGGGGVPELSTRIAGGAGADAILAGPAADSIDPGEGADTVLAGDGSDYVVASPGAPDGPDHFDLGGGPFDRVTYLSAQSAVSISLNAIADDGGEGEGDNVIGAETVVGGPQADTLIGSDRTDETPGFVVTEFLDGGEGDDLIIGGAGDDSLDGGSDFGNDGDDVIRAGAGNDVIDAGGGSDRFAGGAGKDDARAGPGRDRGSGGSGKDKIYGDNGADRLRGGGGSDRLRSASATGGGDGDRDRLDCGPSRDRARADRGDAVRRCESVAVTGPPERD